MATHLEKATRLAALIYAEYRLYSMYGMIEVILYGSVAKGRGAMMSDIDLMLLIDEGAFSSIVPIACQWEDMYIHLKENFLLMMSFLGIERATLNQLLEGTEVDLHVLPISLSTSREVRLELAAKHKDPRFFKNAFSAAMWYDDFMGWFEPITLQDMERRYGCDLSDLK